MNRDPYHRREFEKAVEMLEGVISSADWQQEHIDPAFRDRRPAAQPMAMDGNRNHHISRDRFRKAADKLFVALTDVRAPHVGDERDELIRLMVKARAFYETAYSLDRSNALDAKRERAEEMLDFAEDVDEYLTERE